MKQSHARVIAYPSLPKSPGTRAFRQNPLWWYGDFSGMWRRATEPLGRSVDAPTRGHLTDGVRWEQVDAAAALAANGGTSLTGLRAAAGIDSGPLVHRLAKGARSVGGA